MKADECGKREDESLLISRGCVWKKKTKAEIYFEAQFKAVSIVGIHAA